jgi:hypothetical protein
MMASIVVDWSITRPERNAMKRLALVASTAAALLTAVPIVGTTQALAQVGVEIGPRTGVYVGPRHRPHCRTVTISEWRHGARVTRTERRCGRDWD